MERRQGHPRCFCMEVCLGDGYSELKVEVSPDGMAGECYCLQCWEYWELQYPQALSRKVPNIANAHVAAPAVVVDSVREAGCQDVVEPAAAVEGLVEIIDAAVEGGWQVLIQEGCWVELIFYSSRGNPR